MLLSINFLRDYLDIDKDIDIIDFSEKMTKLGNEYDSAERFINVDGLLIGKVEKCESHPDSDHLHVCKVDLGNKKVQIVCGAPNVREGIKVIVAPDGTKLPGGEIKKTIIRGQESNGMLCSIAELGLDSKFLKEEDKAGIHELDDDAPIGEDPIEYMGWNDYVVDFDLTANRGDLLSILGMAYEVGSIYDKKVKKIDLNHKEYSEETLEKSGDYKLPENDIAIVEEKIADMTEKIEKDKKLNFKLKINTDNCKLFLAKKVMNVQIKESPAEIKEKLMASGIRPINNVVDISNYVMLETGQPLHFYDADTLNGMLEVRMAEEEEKLTTLDGQERLLNSDDIVISDGERSIGLAGVMGGLDTEITDNTVNVIIESAIFDSVKVRRTSNKVLRSEASNRFEKGLNPNRTYIAIERACHLLEKYAEGKVIEGISKYDKIEKEYSKVDITVSKINKVLGTIIDKKDILDVFRKLGFEYETEEKDDKITVIVPKRRIDISIKEDLIEEVGRIYGVDNIEGRNLALPVKKGSYDKTKREIRNKMMDLGLNETLSYVLVNPEEAGMFTNNEHEKVEILSPLTVEKSVLRQSLSTALYKIYQYNSSRNNQDISIFEIGKSFYKDGNDYVEENKLACLMTGEYNLGLKTQSVDFYVIKGVAEEVLNHLGYEGRYSFKVDNNIPKDLHPGKSAIITIDGKSIGIIGRINPIVCKEDVYVMEINLEILNKIKTGSMKYKELSKFPSVRKDISIIVDNDTSAEDLQKAIKNAGGRVLQSVRVFDLYTGKGIPEGKKSIAFSVELSDSKKTFTDDEIAEIMNKISENLSKKYNAELRK
ncbi:MAG: phenylalanine--tRNA ligase subunit beta [Clostridia bacterium]|nr:phenylalanine--tRNA ligase subunit beta [Clostridia bacterium]